MSQISLPPDEIIENLDEFHLVKEIDNFSAKTHTYTTGWDFSTAKVEHKKKEILKAILALDFMPVAIVATQTNSDPLIWVIDQANFGGGFFKIDPIRTDLSFTRIEWEQEDEDEEGDDDDA